MCFSLLFEAAVTSGAVNCWALSARLIGLSLLVSWTWLAGWPVNQLRNQYWMRHRCTLPHSPNWITLIWPRNGNDLGGTDLASRLPTFHGKKWHRRMYFAQVCVKHYVPHQAISLMCVLNVTYPTRPEVLCACWTLHTPPGHQWYYLKSTLNI